MVRIQTFACDIKDLAENNDTITGYDSEKQEMYPTMIDTIIEDFIVDVIKQGGALVQLIPFFQNEKLVIIILYDDNPSPTLKGSNLHIPK